MLEGRRFWFVGIGGAGMSALALVTKEWGAEVGGSDRARSSYVERLEAAGIAVAIGHDAANVPEGAEVIVSSAIGPDNPDNDERPHAYPPWWNCVGVTLLRQGMAVKA